MADFNWTRAPAFSQASKALETRFNRIIVFEVGGVIDLQGSVLLIEQPYVSILGQTAPDPGITIIRGGISIQTSQVIVQHIRVRPGENDQPKKSGWEPDGLSTSGAHHVIVDHCSFSWAPDENLSASGPRFEGYDLLQWRQNTSHDITFSYNLIAQGLSNSTHTKGEHSKGSLIHDNTTNIAIIGNVFASNVRRNPFFKGGAQGVVINNYIYNPGQAAIHYNLSRMEWGNHAWIAGKMAVIGNVLEQGPDTDEYLAYGIFSGPVEVFWQDNIVIGKSLPEDRITVGDHTLVLTRPVWSENITVQPARSVKDVLLDHAGARPWKRDEIDQKMIDEIRKGTNRIIDSEAEMGGYPRYKETREKFDPDLWQLESRKR